MGLSLNLTAFPKQHVSALISSLAEKLLTHRLQEADVFSQRAHTATEGEDEHEDPHHQQHYSGVHRQTPQSGL